MLLSENYILIMVISRPSYIFIILTAWVLNTDQETISKQIITTPKLPNAWVTATKMINKAHSFLSSDHLQGSCPVKDCSEFKMSKLQNKWILKPNRSEGKHNIAETHSLNLVLDRDWNWIHDPPGDWSNYLDGLIHFMTHIPSTQATTLTLNAHIISFYIIQWSHTVLHT